MRDATSVGAAGDMPWFAPALALLNQSRGAGITWGASFSDGEPIMVGRAPARLDVMGGIADYSGSLVLQLPLSRSTWAMAQRQAEPIVELVSLREGREHHFAMELAPLLGGALQRPDNLRAWFARPATDRWAAYVMGVVQACLTRVVPPVPGVRLLIGSDVPEGKGVSSSAALEVACFSALAACWNADFDAEETAAACQGAENHVAGAPCGIMDQVTASCGESDRLLRLLCQPATIEGHAVVPEGYRFYGIDSGIRHAVTGADYGTVRTAAFMGYRIIADRLGLEVITDGPRVRVTDPRFGGYLANMPPHEFARDHAAALPLSMPGAEFLARYHGTTDMVTRVDAGRAYPVRVATAHPVHEHARVQRFAGLLGELARDPGAAPAMGRLMRASHDSYGACGLGSDGTDLLVAMVEEAGTSHGLFGAKITGGGSGGTVAILGSAAAEAPVREIARRYEERTGRRAEVFAGSGPGAAATGVLRLDRGSR